MIQLTYTDRCIPPSFYQKQTEIWKRVSAVIKRKCISQKYHLPNRNEEFAEQSFAVPVIFTCLPFKNEPNKFHGINIDKPIYLHVYGLRRAFYLAFWKDNVPNIEKWFDEKELWDLLQILRGCCFQIYDLKLVYATPNIGAWEGERLMLKIYVSDYISPRTFKTKIHVLKNSCELIRDLNLNIVHDASIPKDVKWMNKYKCDPCGYLWIKNNQAFVHEQKDYIELHAFYKDVYFHPTEPIVLKPEDKQKLLSVTTDDADIHSYVEFQIIQSNINMEAAFSDWKNSKQILQRVYSQDFVQQFLGQHSPYITPTNKSNDLCKRTAIVKQGLLKLYKEKLRILKKSRNLLTPKNEENVFKISSQKRWLVFDIETDYEPNVVKEETILMIACSVFTHDTKNEDCLESQIFTRLSKHMNQNDIDIRQVIRMVNTEFNKGSIHFPHLQNPNKFFIIPCKNEKELLLKFQSYVQQSNCSFVASFNGFKFDLPFVENRYKKLMTREKFDDKVAPKYFEFSFSLLPDRGEIKYYQQYKESALRTKGVNLYVDRHKHSLKINKSRKGYSGAIDETGDDDVCDDDDIDIEEQLDRQNNHDHNQFQLFLKHARNIRIIAMNFVTLVDVMYIVGDPLRGIKLNTAAQKFLQINKIEDVDVEYKNLLQSWRNETKISKVLAYCLVDTLLLTALIRVKEINLFYCAIASNIGLPEREIYTEESMKRLTAFTNRLGYEENLLTHDTSLFRNEVELWVPDSMWKSKDYNHLKPCGGSTMECYGFFTDPIFVADAQACYPSIMQSKNICSTAFIEKLEVALKKIPSDQILTIELENVRPVVEHTCKRERGWCPIENPMKSNIKCKTKYHYERVTYPVHYVNKSYYISILSRAANYLTQLRNDYKRRLKIAESQNDKIKANIYNECQRAAKILTNSLYGATMRNFGVIGDSITYMARWQTKQLCQLAKSYNMYVVNGDTDSVFLTFFKDPNVFSNFSTLATALHLDPTSSSIIQIFQRLIEKANEFIVQVNGNPPHIKGMFPQPYKLELEKIFLHLINLAKKSYVGDKILPDSLSISAHRSGITGKKADTSIIKTVCQLMAIKLIFLRDIIGMVRFCKDIYDLGVWFIRLEESKEKQISKAIEMDRQLQMNTQTTPPAATFVHLGLLQETKQAIKGIQDKHEEHIKKTFLYFNLKMFESHERVGDLSKAVTLAAKRALRDYKIMEENIQKIPKTYALCRSSKVQLGSNILKLIQILVEQSDVSSSDHQYIIKQFQQANLISNLCQNKIQKTKAITKFDITSIPKIYHAPISNRYQLSPHELTRLLHLHEYITIQEKNIEYSDKHGKMLRCPPDIENKVLEKRLWNFLENTSIENNPFPPPCCFRGPVAEQVVPYKSPDCYIISNSCCDIWEWFHQLPINSQAPFLMISCIKDQNQECEQPKVLLKTATMLPENDSTFTYYNRDQHNFVNLGVDNTIVMLDMNSYIKQTTSTPIICPSYDGYQIYITNNTSYVTIRENYFSMTIDRQQLFKTLTSSTLKMAKAITFTGIENSNLVSITPITGSNSLTNLTLTPWSIWRADGRKSTTKWKYPTGTFNVNKQNLMLALNELTGTKKEYNKYVILSFDSITKNLTLFLENQMIEITLYFETNELKKVNYVRDLQHLRVNKCRKEAEFMQNWLSSFVA